MASGEERGLVPPGAVPGLGAAAWILRLRPVPARFQARFSGAGHHEAHRLQNREDHAMPKTRIGRAAGGVVLLAAVAAGSLSLTATAASAVNCPPPAAVPASSSSGSPSC